VTFFRNLGSALGSRFGNAGIPEDEETDMTNWRVTAFCSVLFGCAAAAPLAAADFNMKIKAADIEFGESVMGPKLSPDDLKGKVVLVEFWGIN
jgi:hypothetical protein